jgi:2'-5' RNA ligase
VVQSVELVLDERGDAAVRAQWRRLAEAGLPSMAHHRSASNRPHVTLAALPAVDDAVEPDLRRTCHGSLPLTVVLGAPAVFGPDPYVLVRVVVATTALLDLHRRVAELVGTPAGTNQSPGAWTPHVTLARRVPGHRLAQALEAAFSREVTVTLPAARRWDGDRRREWSLRPSDDL